MDRRFLEFWGNLMLQAAQGQKQLEDLNEWMRLGFKGYEDFASLFRRSFDLQEMNETSPEYFKAWQRAAQNFQDSFKEFMDLIGVVPRSEHLELVRKYEDLKSKLAAHEETIKHLNSLLASKGVEESQLNLGLQDIMAKQSEQFRELMEGFNRYLQQNSSDQGDQE